MRFFRGTPRMDRMSTCHDFRSLHAQLATERATLVRHPIYSRLDSLAGLRTFMEHHAFAVWDFMSLLKSLQRELTCVSVPWVPRGEAVSRRLVNEIVVGEESDDGVNDGFTSHLELYLAAMQECGADRSRIEALVRALQAGAPLGVALDRARPPAAARAFVDCTFEIIASQSIVQVAAAFTLGREELIPDMFSKFVEDLSRREQGRLGLFLDYLRRHIAMDGERHGPMSARLLEHLCAGDAARWTEALQAARKALQARRALWDGIVLALPREQHVVVRT